MERSRVMGTHIHEIPSRSLSSSYLIEKGHRLSAACRCMPTKSMQDGETVFTHYSLKEEES